MAGGGGRPRGTAPRRKGPGVPEAAPARSGEAGLGHGRRRPGAVMVEAGSGRGQRRPGVAAAEVTVACECLVHAGV
jgi:hypothetical protein